MKVQNNIEDDTTLSETYLTLLDKFVEKGCTIQLAVSALTNTGFTRFIKGKLSDKLLYSYRDLDSNDAFIPHEWRILNNGILQEKIQIEIDNAISGAVCLFNYGIKYDEHELYLPYVKELIKHKNLKSYILFAYETLDYPYKIRSLKVLCEEGLSPYYVVLEFIRQKLVNTPYFEPDESLFIALMKYFEKQREGSAKYIMKPYLDYLIKANKLKIVKKYKKCEACGKFFAYFVHYYESIGNHYCGYCVYRYIPYLMKAFDFDTRVKNTSTETMKKDDYVIDKYEVLSESDYKKITEGVNSAFS